MHIYVGKLTQSKYDRRKFRLVNECNPAKTGTRLLSVYAFSIQSCRSCYARLLSLSTPILQHSCKS